MDDLTQRLLSTIVQHPGTSSTESNHCRYHFKIEKNQFANIPQSTAATWYKIQKAYFDLILRPLHGRKRVHWFNTLRSESFYSWCRIWFNDGSHFMLQKHDELDSIGVWINVLYPCVSKQETAPVQKVSLHRRLSLMTVKRNWYMFLVI